MSARFVQVPAAAIRERLAAAGFRLIVASHGEEVYQRKHDRDDRYTIFVYSSIQRGASEARDCGEDAIRVVAVYSNSKFHWPAREVPIFKATRVHRAGSVEAVLDRMIERAREAYAHINHHRRGSSMNTVTERPDPLIHTFTITVDVDPRWIDYITQHSTIFGRPHYAGYWACGAAHDLALGWLVAECDENEMFPDEDETERMEALWRAGKDLPPRWYRLDRAAAIRMWEEGVKMFGVGWYESNKHDGTMEDVLLQHALLGEARYG